MTRSSMRIVSAGVVAGAARQLRTLVSALRADQRAYEAAPTSDWQIPEHAHSERGLLLHEKSRCRSW